MKASLLAALLLILGLSPAALAQQQPQFTHYSLNGMFLNPAYAGIKGYGEFNVIGRYQYLNYGGYPGDANGSPRTGMFTASLPLLALKGGVGLSVYHDLAGEQRLTNAALSYSQHLKLGDGQLGIGVQGVLTYIGKGEYRPIDRNDPLVPLNDSDRKFDAGVGVWYESPKFYAGLSMNNLFRSTYTLQSAVRNDPNDPDRITGYQNTSQFLGENHAYLTAGYNIDLTDAVVLTPTAIVKAVLPGSFTSESKFFNSTNYSVEAGARATLNERFWLGANYRYDESVSGLFGLSFAKDNALSLGVAYDFIAFNQEARAVSSLEVMLSYRLPRPTLFVRPAIRTPRYSF
jgi:type IX secretion system PorP/SprF family membrane protein